MLGNDFFKEIEHTAVPWRQYELHVPIFYPDINFMMISMVAPLEKIKTLLPSPRMKPYRISPWHSLLTITGYQYKECDLGPYNEVSVGVPITLDKETPLFTGSLRKLPKSLVTYVRHLPVTTQIAYEVGAEFAGYPKFVAGIDFSEDNDWFHL